jgi:hypothetical protein
LEVRSDRTFVFPVGPDDLWTALTSVGRYRSWWPWLRRFDGTPFVAGARWRCAVRAPLGYPVRFDVVLEEVVAGRSAAAVVSGDIAGSARLDVVATDGGGSRLRLVSTLTSERWLLRAIARLAPPVARFGHDRLLDMGVRQFRAQAFIGEA